MPFCQDDWNPWSDEQNNYPPALFFWGLCHRKKRWLSGLFFFFYRCDRTAWPRQFTEGRAYLGLWFQRASVHNAGYCMTAATNMTTGTESWEPEPKARISNFEQDVERIKWKEHVVLKHRSLRPWAPSFSKTTPPKPCTNSSFSVSKTVGDIVPQACALPFFLTTQRQALLGDPPGNWQ